MRRYFIYQLAREHQTELRHEAEKECKARKTKTGKSATTRRMLSMIPALVVLMIVLAKIFS